MKYDVSERRIDRSRPTAPTIRLKGIRRGTGLIQAAGVVAQNAEGALGSISFVAVGATDDRTPPEQLGYRFHHVDGDLPQGLVVSDGAFLLQSGARLTLYWADGRTWDQERFLFRVTVTAVDRAGNESPPSNIVIVGDGGDMSWVKRQSEVSLERSRWVAVQRTEGGTNSKAVIDTAQARWSRARPRSPAAIQGVFDSVTVNVLTEMHSGRIDRVTSPHAPEQDGVAKEPDQRYMVVEFGRELSRSEVLQLRSILLEPDSYLTDSYMCEFWPEFAFGLQSESTRFAVVLGAECHIVQIRINDSDHFRSLTEKAAPILRAFCNGLLELPLLDEE